MQSEAPPWRAWHGCGPHPRLQHPGANHRIGGSWCAECPSDLLGHGASNDRFLRSLTPRSHPDTGACRQNGRGPAEYRIERSLLAPSRKHGAGERWGSRSRTTARSRETRDCPFSRSCQRSPSTSCARSSPSNGCDAYWHPAPSRRRYARHHRHRDFLTRTVEIISTHSPLLFVAFTPAPRTTAGFEAQ